MFVCPNCNSVTDPAVRSDGIRCRKCNHIIKDKDLANRILNHNLDYEKKMSAAQALLFHSPWPEVQDRRDTRLILRSGQIIHGDPTVQRHLMS